MTLDEKIGQMTQVDQLAVTISLGHGDDIANYFIGSVLRYIAIINELSQCGQHILFICVKIQVKRNDRHLWRLRRFLPRFH